MVEHNASPNGNRRGLAPGSKAARFKPGWKGGPGNPLGALQEKLRHELGATFRQRGLAKLAAKLLDMAEAGDANAARLVLQYAVGQPTQPIEMSGTLQGPAPVIVVRDFGGSDGTA